MSTSVKPDVRRQPAIAFILVTVLIDVMGIGLLLR